MGRSVAASRFVGRLGGLGVAAGRKALGAALVDRDRAALEMARVATMTVPGPAGDLAARLYSPVEGADQAPLMIYFHGGGFAFCDAATHDALCRRLAHGSGVRILSVDYRLAPEHAWPAQLDDALAAARWVLTQGGEIGPRGMPLILGGDSAGAYLALAAARALNAARSGAVGLTCLIYPLLHLDDAVWDDGSRRLGRFTIGVIRSRLTAPPPSLLDADVSGDPPCLLTFGGRADPVRPDCLAYEAALTAAGVTVTAQGFADLPHGYANLTHLLAKARAAVDETAGLLAQAAHSSCAAAAPR